MKKTFLKNLFRDIYKTFSRFLSIVIIIAVGVAFYAGVRATSPDMKKSGDYYFDKTNFMDFKLISTLGITKNNISEIKKVSGIKDIYGSKSIDEIVVKNKHSLVVNINSLPENNMNKLLLTSGRKPNNDKEVVVEERFLKENKFKIGDKITIKSGNDTNIKDSLKEDKFKIVGTAKSPLYFSTQRQLSSVGDGSVKGFIYILPEVFKSEVYTEVYVTTDKDETKNSLMHNDEYKEANNYIEKDLKNLGKKLNKERYKEVYDDANNKIKDAEDKLKKAEKEADNQFKEGYKKLSDAQQNIYNGKNELNKNEALFNNKIADGQKQISDGQKQIEAAEAEINLKSKDIENGKVSFEAAKKQISYGEAQLSEGKAQAANSINSAIKEKVEGAKKQLESDPTNTAYIYQYNVLNRIYENDINGKTFDDIYNALKNDGSLSQISSYFDIEGLKNNFNAGEAKLSQGKQQIAANEAVIYDGEAKLEEGKKELETNKLKISNAEAQLETSKKEGQEKLDEAKNKIEAGQKEIDDNTKNLKEEEAKANKKFKDAEEDIADNKDKLKDIKSPDFYVLGRSQNIGYESYRQDSNRIDNIGKAFPLIFFLVAALVSLTTMTRMVQENRIEIGTFKALGYSKGTIISHYLIYALLASLIGSLIGISFGFRLFPPLIINAYGSLYAIPKAITPFNVILAVEASIIAIFFTTVAAVASTMEELREVPASLMRPKPPKAGKLILLERITFIWNRLKFTRKVTARNIFRYKQRLFMTVIGIAACTGLMITGFELKSGIRGAVEKQFTNIYKYDIQTNLKNEIDYAKKEKIKSELKEDSNIKSELFTYSKNVTVKNKNSSNMDAYMVVPENKDELNKYIGLNKKNKALELSDDGVIVTEKLSKLTGKKVGDVFDVMVNGKTMKVKISAVTEHYIQHYIYVSPKYYKKISGEKAKFNGFYGLLKSTSTNSQNNTSKILSKIKDVGSVSFKNNVQFDSNKSMKSINSVVLILIAAAGVLAFVVIYNLTNININERRRELATIKLFRFLQQ
ncbi:ABC transporter permease [Clostridium sp. DMHC 10]|uniref:ABC transporter permease n=1 Tax=Clostridium sp. DMHC 10 TaxID=747377 RepID=UPI000A7DCBB1|nr:ABC transporter permease [Clostridium sp. DMHC 10]